MKKDSWYAKFYLFTNYHLAENTCELIGGYLKSIALALIMVASISFFASVCIFIVIAYFCSYYYLFKGDLFTKIYNEGYISICQSVFIVINLLLVLIAIAFGIAAIVRNIKLPKAPFCKSINWK